MASTTDRFITKQSTNYQNHLKSAKSLKRTLRSQQEAKQHQTIPRQHTANPPTTGQSTINAKFKEQCKQLFFQQLDEAITSNITSLELHTTHLESILTQTERHLANTTETKEEITKLYQNFLSSNEITDRTPIPELQAKLKTDTQPQPRSHTQ